MNDIAIRIENLSKRYRIGARQKRANTLRETLENLAASPSDYLRRTLRGPTEEEILWALKDVSFEVKQGEVVGIIGRNGAGKTTLLKILSRITEPTEGRAGIHGRVASLLEVGTGFHPELTGRENIYLNGTILGMKQAEIERKFDEMVDFSGVEKFIDTPVKRYSSGMNVRLGFSVAAHLEPEILLVDEVLAVGDAEFQKKCLGKMQDVTGEGRTVLFVSHNMAMIRRLCPEALLLNEGHLQMRGPSSEVVETYLEDDTEQLGEYIWQEQRQNDTDVFVPLSLRILDHEGRISNRVLARYPFQIEFRYRLTRDVSSMRVALTLRTLEGEWVFASYDRDGEERSWYTKKAGNYVATCTIPENLLNSKTFILGVIAQVIGGERFYREPELIRFSVDLSGGVGAHWGDAISRAGVIRPALDWETQFLA